MTVSFLRRRSLLTGLPFLMMPTLTFAQMRVADTTLDILAADPPTHRLDDRVVRLDKGRSFRIFRAIPKADAPPAGYPVLTLLDGNAVFDDLTPELLALAPNLVVIGLGYDTPRKFAQAERSLDYTPPKDPAAGPYADPARQGRMYGGAELFLEMLLGPLRTQSEAGLAVDPQRRHLGGHSFGGLFALYALFRRPQSFAGYAPISPSLWWAPETMARLEDRAVLPAGHPLKLFVALGDKEQRSNDKGPPPTGPAPETMALIERLSRRPQFTVSSEVLKDHVHGATLAGALPLMLGWASAS
ncbi:alpha/beta hydrolase-fold protein [Rhizobium sp. CSW-27]|uniref:alpha/beta hydrolase n=1 Tax=Rhizobium sp. CSW-27 TaxID=2839985 RepID=UPI001C01F104|nr:alpha/beta hydrolase-fold protein [Rhizobium sp. CSW-27]MBT9369396.1 hypothetical protein [Rhizobium sp. CSW-27]